RLYRRHVGRDRRGPGWRGRPSEGRRRHGAAGHDPQLDQSRNGPLRARGRPRRRQVGRGRRGGAAGGRFGRLRRGSGVADGQDLPEVTVRVVPVQVPSTETRVDLHVVLTARVAAVRDSTCPDTAEDRVEGLVADTEAEGLALELVPMGEVERQGAVDVDRGEAALRLGPGHVEKLREELCPLEPVVRWNDDVIQLDSHGTPPEVTRRYCKVSTSGVWWPDRATEEDPNDRAMERSGGL